MSTPLAVLLAAPWILAPVVTALRMRRSRTLAEFSAEPAGDAPFVSIVIPARNEERNVERCVRSALAARYPQFEVIAVDDHSTDATAAILASIAAEDHRLRIVTPPPLPPGWFGKQWACTAGFDASRGAIVGFLDADTWHASDLVPRVVRAMTDLGADLFTVGGRQELGGFWEKVLQPQAFSMLAVRYGGAESVNNSRRVRDKIANGQCLFVTREAYVALGGHMAVRDKVAEDLALAQRFFAQGRRTVLVLGREQLSTRMYTSLGEIVEGWAKNIYVGGRDAMPGGRPGQWLYPLALPCRPCCSSRPSGWCCWGSSACCMERRSAGRRSSLWRTSCGGRWCIRGSSFRSATCCSTRSAPRSFSTSRSIRSCAERAFAGKDETTSARDSRCKTCVQYSAHDRVFSVTGFRARRYRVRACKHFVMPQSVSPRPILLTAVWRSPRRLASTRSRFPSTTARVAGSDLPTRLPTCRSFAVAVRFARCSYRYPLANRCAHFSCASPRG
jgi:chlorobactene glucosyltransferase